MVCKYFRYYCILCLLLFISSFAHSQCNTLRPQIDITFNTDQDCAPTTVTDFTIKYFFNVAQNPNDIIIRFRWNDPTNAITNVDIFSGLIASAGNTEFEATGTFMYPINNDCSFLPTSYVVIAGVECPTSEQEQTAFSWARDNEFGGTLAIAPAVYEVCHGDPIVNAVFTDASTFNCNIVDEPDNPNRQTRSVQFVYGTNQPPTSIRNLTLNDGAVQTLTDGVGALASTTTRGTAGLMVTAAYFGPVDLLPFPADAPISATFPMSAPADLLNLVGNTFEVTMYNWNICNPYNGDPVNPNYDEAMSITANIEIVAAPAPNFQTREVNAGGLVTTDFCIGEVVYFDNLTGGGGLNYFWQYFDGPADTDPLLGTSAATNPTNIFLTGGQKLIRLTASNPTAQSACAFSVDLIISVTPTLVADIRVTDLADVDITPHFCQDAATSQTFDVRFYDIAIGTATANTDRRWEFYDQTGALSSSIGFITGIPLVNPPDQVYTVPGNYEVKFITRDNITGCETEVSTFVRIYSEPVSSFTATEVCDGVDTRFEDTSALTAAINGESIVTYEWDFNYDGITFTKDAAFDGMTSFDRNMGAANTYNVALRVVTDQKNCENIFAQNVFVRPLPLATFTIDQTDGCSVLPIEFTNTGHAGQPANVIEYVWQIDFNDGFGFVDYETQDPLMVGFSTVFTRNFANNTLINQILDVRLQTENIFGCITTSPVQSITVFPAPQAGFTDLNYDPFAMNCGSASVDFEVDAVTQGLGPTSYTWQVTDELGMLLQPDEVNVPPNSTFSFIFNNPSTTDVMDFGVRLTTDFVGGCPSDSIRTIRVNPAPSALFDIDTLLLDCQLMTVQMEASQKGLAEYAWEIIINGVTSFSSTSVGDVFDRDFNRPAVGSPALNVDVRLQTTNFANCQSNIEQFSFVVLPQDDINASFNVTPLTQTLPDRTVTLTNTTVVGNWNYLWDFGDGQTSTDPNIANHIYDTYGVYVITLTVNSTYCEEIAIQSITINPTTPVLDFDFIPENGCAPLRVDFTNLSEFADEASYMWDFGDGETLAGAVNPTHIYTSPGIFNVTLSADNGAGDGATIVKEGIIEVYPAPSAIFSIRPEVVFLPNPIYTNNSSFGAISFLWDFGDGTTSTEFEPIHTYMEVNTDDEGNEIGYDISLVATSENGCVDSLILPSVVTAKRSQKILIANAFSPSLVGPSSNGSVTGGNLNNDIFLPLFDSDRVSSFQMLIFNKWGELLFESTSKENGWDGYYNGILVQQDVYVYRLSVEFDTGDKETRVGDVTLIR